MFLLFFMLISVSGNDITTSFPCKMNLAVDLTAGQRYGNGTIVYDNLTFPKEYTFERNTSGLIKTFGCPCKIKKCIRKCCDLGEVKNMTGRPKVCEMLPDYDEVVNKGLDIFFYNVYDKKASLKDFFALTGRPCLRMYVENDFEWYMQETGELYIEYPNRIPPWVSVGPDKYCIDTFLYEKDGVKKTQLDALVCFKDSNDDQHESYYPISSTCMLISCVFILATVAVYAWLPELQNLHGRVLMAYLLCLFVGFIFMSTMQILLLKNIITVTMCVSFTIIIYFSLQSAFFWLNVMCFDIWWTFSGKRGISENMSTRARFGAYAVYAFGVPSVLTILIAALEFSGLPPHAFMPNIRVQGCFISGFSRALYFYGPIAILCIANIIYFVLTAVKIAQIKSQTSVLKSKESARHDQHRNENDKQRFFLYVKLFVVMGVNWLLEVASGTYPNAFDWKYTDAYNVLIGVFIFIIFVCKKKILKLIKKRYRQMRGDSISRTQTVSSRTASTREDYRMSSIKTSTA